MPGKAKRLVRIARWGERGKGNGRVSSESSFKLLFLKKFFEANRLRLEKAGGGHITFIMFFSVFPGFRIFPNSSF